MTSTSGIRPGDIIFTAQHRNPPKNKLLRSVVKLLWRLFPRSAYKKVVMTVLKVDQGSRTVTYWTWRW